MNLRFPQIFSIVMLLALLCSVGMSPAASRRVSGTFQAAFAPVAGPIHWAAGTAQKPPTYIDDAPPLLPGISDERTRLREENRMLREQLARLTQQIDAIRTRIAEAERLGPDLARFAVQIRVIGLADGGRQVLKLSGTDRSLSGGEVVVYTSNGSTGLVGKVLPGVGAGNQAQVRLITDKDMRFQASFGRMKPGSAAGADAQFQLLGDGQRVVLEGMGTHELRALNLSMADVNRMGLKVGDPVFLAGPESDWPIETRALRVGTVSQVKKNLLQELSAEVRVTPELELSRLNEVMVIVR